MRILSTLFTKSLCCSYLFIFSFNCIAAQTQTLEPKPAADFTLSSLNGKALRLKEQQGQVILLNFWASWCGPCREEMPLLNALHNKYQDLGFSVIGINVESTLDKATAFLKDTPVDFPILLDNQKTVSELYQVSAMPTTYLIDRKGQLRYLHHGYESGHETVYETQIKALVRE